MDLQEQLKRFGLVLVNGDRRVQGALSAGSAISASDDQGNTYLIKAANGQITVTQNTGPFQPVTTVIVRRLPGEFLIPKETMEPNPLNPRSPDGLGVHLMPRAIPNNVDQQQVKRDLLTHLNSELAKSEAWVCRNDGEGFPEAADGHRVEVSKWKNFIALVETLS